MGAGKAHEHIFHDVHGMRQTGRGTSSQEIQSIDRLLESSLLLNAGLPREVLLQRMSEHARYLEGVEATHAVLVDSAREKLCTGQLLPGNVTDTACNWTCR